jgi:hypothetical protein
MLRFLKRENNFNDCSLIFFIFKSLNQSPLVQSLPKFHSYLPPKVSQNTPLVSPEASGRPDTCCQKVFRPNLFLFDNDVLLFLVRSIDLMTACELPALGFILDFAPAGAVDALINPFNRYFFQTFDISPSCHQIIWGDNGDKII